MHIRDTSSASMLQATCSDDLFWDQASAIGFIIEPVVALMSWAQGCDCHEEELKAGKMVTCSFKGCRAKNLANAVRQTLADVQQKRAQLVSGEHPRFGSVGAECLVSALDISEVSLKFKMHWVHELPFLVWQVISKITHNRTSLTLPGCVKISLHVILIVLC